MDLDRHDLILRNVLVGGREHGAEFEAEIGIRAQSLGNDGGPVICSHTQL